MSDLLPIQKGHSEKFASIVYLKFISSLYYKKQGGACEAVISKNHFENSNKTYRAGKR